MRWTVLAALALLVAGCGSTAPPAADDPSGSRSSGEPDAPPVVRGIGMVLDDGDGPVLCLGPVLESLPPQCGGPELVGWEWAGVEAARRAGVRWTGEYVVTGRFDGTRLTLTEPPVPSEEYDGPRPRRSDEDDPLGTPCPEPAGGWRPVDPERTTEHTLQRVARAAQALDGFAGLWWDQSVNPAYDDPDGQDTEYAMNDPAKLVVNVAVTGDPAAAEAELRKVWGGALCVTQAQRTEAELRRIQHEVARTPGTISASSGHDVVELDVEYDDGSLQQRFDQRYGEGVVRVHSALFPVES